MCVCVCVWVSVCVGQDSTHLWAVFRLCDACCSVLVSQPHRSLKRSEELRCLVGKDPESGRYVPKQGRQYGWKIYQKNCITYKNPSDIKKYIFPYLLKADESDTFLRCTLGWCARVGELGAWRWWCWCWRLRPDVSLSYFTKPVTVPALPGAGGARPGAAPTPTTPTPMDPWLSERLWGPLPDVVVVVVVVVVGGGKSASVLPVCACPSGSPSRKGSG